MEKQSYLTKSRYLLLFLFALIVGSGSAWADGKALPYSYGFETTLAAEGWTTSGSSIPTNTAIMSDAKRSGNKGFQFWYNTNPPQYLISPELTTSDATLNLSFWYKNGSTYTETFNVGYSTSNSEAGSFTWLETTDITAPSSWTEYTKTLPAGTKYVAIKYTANNQYKLWIDDFCVSEVEAYPKPTDFEFTGYTATSASFTWTNGKDETAWQIAYSTTQGFDAGSVSPVDVTTKPYTLTGLTAETTYYARIRADYGSGNYSKWSDEINFKPSAATNTTVNDGSGSNGYVPFYGSYADTDGTMSQFITPSSSLTAIQNRQITKLTFYGTASLNFGTAKFKVYMKETDATSFANTTFDWTDMDEVANASVSTDSEGKMVIELESPFDYSDGNLMIGFKISATGDWKSTTWTGVSSGSAIYAYNGSSSSASFLPKMTITSLPQSSAPKKPKNFDDSATTTTTATLGWTNGGDETAWQIAYSTDTDFNPDTEGTKVAVDANPYTLTGLTAGTTYYAYIRAKKAEEYSDWSNKADFTTLSAVPVIELSATNHNFGFVTNAAAQAFSVTISNTGGADLTGLSVTPTSGFAVTDAEGNALTATTIAAGGSLTIKIKMNAVGQQNGTVTIDGNEIDEQIVNVSGYLLDNTKICETFASKPDRWKSTGSWTYNATTGAYSTTYGGSTLTSPKIIVGESEKLTISAKSAYSGASYYVKIEGSSDNGSTFTAYTKQLSTASDPALSTSDFTIVTLDDVPTTVNKLRITAYYGYINALNGFTYDEDPQLALYSDEDCTVAQDATATKNWGFVAAAQQQKYYIKNTGNGQIDLTIEQADGFTAAVDDAALTEGEKATLTIDMAATEGLHNGTITVTAKNHKTNDVLGTFAVTLNAGIAGAKNDIDFVGSSLSALPAGWETTTWSVTNSSYVGIGYNSGAAGDLTSQTYTVGAGETLLFEAKAQQYQTGSLSYSYKAGSADWTDVTVVSGLSNTEWKVFAISGIAAGQAKVKFTGQYVQIRRIYGFEAFSEPVMVFAAEGTTKNFGMITSNTTSDVYTVTNSGTATLEGFGVTCDNSSFDIAITGNVDEIAAGGSATFTVTMNTSDPGEQNGIVTISGTGVADKTFNVKGYLADDTKIFTTFAAKPDRWTNSTSPAWSFSAENGASAGNSGGSYYSPTYATLTSPKITITEGQKLAISAKLQYSGSYYVTINGSSDNGKTWTAYTKTLNNTQLNTTDYTVVEIDDVPTTVNKLQLVGYYVYVNGLNGFTYDPNDPEFGVFSDSEFNSQITSGAATNAWGFANEDKTATYYIKNTGTGTMTLSKGDTPAGFTATLGATSLGAGESTTLTIAMENDAANNEGYHAGNVVLTAKDNADNTLSTFTVTSSGVVVGNKTDINFTALDAFPAGWETTTWTVTANTKATVGYSTGTLTTGTYSVAAGEKMVVLAKKNSNYGTLSYKVSTNGGTDWSAATTITPSSTSDYEMKVIEGIPAGDNVKIEFTGYYADIQRIYGFTAVAKPVMTLSPADASYDFGMQTTAADYVITITNSGTANMTNLAAALSGTDTDDFDVAVSKTTVPYTGENTATITVTMKASTEYKTHNATLTISADGLADKVITLSGKTRDASKWYVDFASEIPSNFVEKGSWSVYSGTARTTASTESSLITQPINLAANEKIYFDAYNPYSGSLKVRYSVNGGISWSDYTDYSASINTSGSFSSHEIDLENDAAVTAIVEFKGRYYIQFDNIYGGTLNNTAPMIKVTKSAAIVENGTTEEFGSIKAEATATYTITNVGNGTLTITDPVSKTGAATATIDATSLANGESATLTITMPVAAPYEYKEGVVTVETNLGNFVINYNATILNPNALDEQFASGKPAGWYFGGEWTVASNQARNDDAGISDLITEQLHVAGTSDALTFQAKRYSNYSAPTWSVAYSTDRMNWTDVDVSGYSLNYSNYTTITVNGLAEGDYYLRIRANLLYVDNFLGWEKKNNTCDLYVTATSFPATTTKGNSATISATVTSLIAAEEGVYAKLFINGVEEATADAQDIALNGTKTFSFTYAIPENKTAQIKVYYSDNSEAFATAVNNMKVNYTFDEEVDPSTITAGTFNVSMTRTFNVGWNTICLPFAMNAEQMEAAFGAEAKAYEFENFADGVLSFQKVTALTAATPYLIYLPDDVSSTLSINDAVVSNTEAQTVTKGGIDFIGTYTPIAAPGMDGKWGVTAAGKIGKGTNTAFINGFRAYFSGSLANARIAFFDENEATGIELIQDSRFKVEDAYDLQGRKVEYLKKGQLYIKNGKKVVIK